MWRVGQKVIYARWRSVAFTAPIFTKLTDPPYIFKVISCIKSYLKNNF